MVGQLTITASNVNCILSYGQHCMTWIIYLIRFLIIRGNLLTYLWVKILKKDFETDNFCTLSWTIAPQFFLKINLCIKIKTYYNDSSSNNVYIFRNKASKVFKKQDLQFSLDVLKPGFVFININILRHLSNSLFLHFTS